MQLHEAHPVADVDESDLIEVLTGSLRPGSRDKGMSVTVKAFFDDSGSDWESKFCVVARPIARASRWPGFVLAWEAALGADPPISYFKMNHAITLRGEFARERGWTDEAAERKVMALTEVMTKHIDAHLVAMVPMTPYREIVRGKTPARWDYPYIASFYHALGLSCEYMHRTHPNDRLVLVFDHQNDCAAQAMELFNTLKDAPLHLTPPSYLYNKYLGTIAFADDKEETALQAADLIAWHYRKAPEDQWRGREKRPVMNRIAGLPIAGLCWGTDALSKWVEGIPNFASGAFRASFNDDKNV